MTQSLISLFMMLRYAKILPPRGAWEQEGPVGYLNGFSNSALKR